MELICQKILERERENTDLWRIIVRDFKSKLDCLTYRILYPFGKFLLSTSSFHSIRNWFLNMLLGCLLLDGRPKWFIGPVNNVNDQCIIGHTTFACSSSALPIWPGYHVTNSCKINCYNPNKVWPSLSHDTNLSWVWNTYSHQINFMSKQHSSLSDGF